MRPINQCLNKTLSNICRKAIQLEALNDIVNQYLPDTIKPHCHVGSFTNGCLTLVLDSHTWSTELRYCLPELRDQLRSKEQIYQLSAIKTVVAQPDEPLKKAHKAAKGLSSNAQHSIKRGAETFEEGSLKEALMKLAK